MSETREELGRELDELRAVRALHVSRADRIGHRMREIKAAMATSANGGSALHVSDHAVVRWLERTGRLNIDTVRAAIADAAERAMESDEIEVEDGDLVYVCDRGAVVTVLTRDQVER